MIKLELLKHTAYPWQQYSNVYIRGYFLQTEAEQVAEIIRSKNINGIKEYVGQLNGCYCIIIKVNDSLYYIISDRCRSFPVFFSIKKKIISDNLREYANNVDIEELACFILRRNTSSSHTLLSDYKSISNSEVVLFDDDNICIERYYEHRISGKANHKEELIKEFEEVTDRVFKRCLSSLKKEQRIIVPLSGGYDSRLIVSKLVDLGMRDRIIAYTYGIPGDYEVDNAKLVADKLGIKWFFCEYKKEEWELLFKNRDELEEYINYSFNYTSLPHLQDYIAIRMLKSKGLISKTDVIIPGYCADFPAGSFIPNEHGHMMTSNGIANYTFYKHFNNTSCSRSVKNYIISKLENSFDNKRIRDIGFDEGERQYEQWCINTRLTMWVLNSLRLFEFFGYEWRIPFWDNEFLEFWYKVDNSMRENCILYKDALFNGLFRKYSIDFAKPKYAEVTSKQNTIKQILRKLVIWASYKTGILFYNRNNTNNYNNAAIMFYKRMKSKKLVDYNNMSIHSMEMLWLCDNVFGSKLCYEALKGSWIK